MKKLFLLTIISTVIYSQKEISNDSLMMIIDSLRINQQLLANQQKMLENQQKILDEVKYFDPLIGKKFGIELNPIGMLFSSGERVRGMGRVCHIYIYIYPNFVYKHTR